MLKIKINIFHVILRPNATYVCLCVCVWLRASNCVYDEDADDN